MVITVAAIVRDLAVALTAGALLLIACVLPRGKAANRASLIAQWSAVVWTVAAAVFLVATASNIFLTSPTAPEFGPQIWQFITEIAVGRAHLQVLIGAAVASVLAGLARSATSAGWALAPVVWGIAWQSTTGHAAGASDHHLAVTAMFLHIVASSVWFGIIAAVALIRRELADDGPVAVRRMSRTAIWAASLIVISGAANGWVRLSGPADLFTSNYGRILTLKLVLMGGAIALAAWHRRTTLPRLTAADVRDRFWRILWVDVALLVAVIGIAGVLAQEAPPVPIAPLPDPTPAYRLTGYPLPPAPSLWNWIALWRIEVASAFVLGAAAVLYVRWTFRLRRRGDHWPLWRMWLFLFGIGILVWVTQGAPTIYGKVSFSAHMVEHMTLVMAVPLPITFAAPVTLALRALSPRTDGSRGPREWTRVIVDSRWMRFWAHPVVAAVNFAGSMLIFYYSPWFDFALRNHAAHLWMVVHFTIVGYLFANALVGIDPGTNRPAYPMRIVLLFATMAFHAFFGVGMTNSQILLAPTYYGLMGRTWGPDAIADQQYGGAIAWGLGEIPVVFLAVAVFIMWRRADTKEGRRLDRQAERDDDAQLRAYNAMLGRIAAADAGGPTGQGTEARVGGTASSAHGRADAAGARTSGADEGSTA